MFKILSRYEDEKDFQLLNEIEHRDNAIEMFNLKGTLLWHNSNKKVKFKLENEEGKILLEKEINAYSVMSNKEFLSLNSEGKTSSVDNESLINKCNYMKDKINLLIVEYNIAVKKLEELEIAKIIEKTAFKEIKHHEQISRSH